MIFDNILSEKQKEVLDKIKNLPEGSYMAGGTALALQLGHRTSLDFDFYVKTDFNSEILFAEMRSIFSNLKLERTAKGTLILDADDVSFSIFRYPYDLIDSLVEFKNIKLASIKDVAAMKMIAISTRGTRRDFIDVYFLLQKFNLGEVLKFTLEKYPGYQQMVILKGLIYFKDAEDEDLSRGITVLDKNYSWEKTKDFIKKEAEKYQLEMINMEDMGKYES